ncbi:SirA-like protein [Helicobacter sp. 13S00482-2]|uniref:sulfurtransferase-like selenium metabolism protein YedF n=1 Tax=Helicobacter sp. 13S00482-2 TaxID=1476200 RepID=UPI000BA5E534|nr:sulfurtransferase-like selenium metabolism protein YedF [Helicobacter sp. 13S00482-2]PAF53914.1 SirA-like protein [Helicobacter sp. 13S00482-2]
MKNQKIIPDYRLELQGETCPYPAIATINALEKLKKGEVLEVLSDCAQSINNIPMDAKNHGYEVLQIHQEGCTISFLIRK